MVLGFFLTSNWLYYSKQDSNYRAASHFHFSLSPYLRVSRPPKDVILPFELLGNFQVHSFRPSNQKIKLSS